MKVVTFMLCCNCPQGGADLRTETLQVMKDETKDIQTFRAFFFNCFVLFCVVLYWCLCVRVFICVRVCV